MFAVDGANSQSEADVTIIGNSTATGKLQQLTEEFEADQFCLAENWEHIGNDDDGYNQDWLDGFHGTLGLSCDQCLEEV